MKTTPRQFERLESRRVLAALYQGFGDFNGDTVFNEDDLIQAFAAGKFETGLAASFEEGDVDGNGVFDTDDMVDMFATGYWQMDHRTPYVDYMATWIKQRTLHQNPPAYVPLQDYEIQYDHNGDGTLSLADVDAYMAGQGTVNGDIDFDGVINTEILTDPESRWNQSYNGLRQDGFRWILGDFDLSSIPGAGDLAIAGLTHEDVAQ
jgi:hypothetical protein